MDRVYFNDEWNEPLTNDPWLNKKDWDLNLKMQRYNYFYSIVKGKLDHLIEEELLKKHTDGKTYLPKIEK